MPLSAKSAVDRTNTDPELPGDCRHGQALAPKASQFLSVRIDRGATELTAFSASIPEAGK